MHEGPPVSPASSPDQPAWDIEAIAQALDTTPTPFPDTGSGTGLSLMVGEVSTFRPFRQVIVELVPSARALWLMTPGLSVELTDLPAPTTTRNQVLFKRQDAARLSHLSITRKGEITLLDVPLSSAPDVAEPDSGSLLGDDTSYADHLATQTPPFGVDDYGFDDAEYARLMAEGFGTDSAH